VALQGQRQLIRRDAHTVIAHRIRASPPCSISDLALGAGIERVLGRA
jgi:hypothetical protein